MALSLALSALATRPLCRHPPHKRALAPGIHWINTLVLLNGSEDFQTAVLRASRGKQCYAETPVSLLRMHAAMVEDGSGAGLDCMGEKQ